MAGNTLTWFGGSGQGATSSDWFPSGGPPHAGDTGIINTGTMVFSDNPTLQSNTVVVGDATLEWVGNNGSTSVNAGITSYSPGTSFFSPTTDQATLIVETGSAASYGNINAAGITVNEGTILADGPPGSMLTINVESTTAGTTTLPGYFYNPGTIQADAGNTVIINIGSATELLNTGLIVADGGTVQVVVGPGVIGGGDAPTRGFDVIEGGGTLETQAFYPAGDGNNGTHAEYVFDDSTPGNTLKIDNVGSFGGAIVGFAAGDTIDLGTSLAVGTLAYSTATNLLSLEAANGTTLATLLVGNSAPGWRTAASRWSAGRLTGSPSAWPRTAIPR